ncbi:MAG: aldehyde dehydrogenase family protein [Pseudomonadota bacterium]
MTIGGAPAPAAEAFGVVNPTSGEVFAECPSASSDQLDEAVRAARRAFEDWRRTPDETRQAALDEAATLLEEHAEPMARLLTLEQGKPLNGLGSRFELGGAAAWTRATAALTVAEEVLQDNDAGKIVLKKKPLGVVGSITPWNFPLMIAIWHVMPALRAGNTVVIKPSPYTPFTTLRLVELLNEALPPGVVNVVTGGDDLGKRMSAHPDIDKMVFTGSIAAGRSVMRSSADTLKRLTLELGGNDAGIVLPDADPAAIAEGLFWGAFINSGQTCAALKRLYVPDALYGDVCDALAGFASTVRVGDGLDEESMLGPVQNERQFDKLRGLVDDAKRTGGTVLCGGEPMDRSGYFYPVTVIADLADDAALVVEEQFGPALPVLGYTDLDDAVARANASTNGLGGSVWSPNVAQAADVGERLECGTVWVNKHGAIQPNAPFGGIKQSGFGVEFAQQGLDEYFYGQVLFR